MNDQRIAACHAQLAELVVLRGQLHWTAGERFGIDIGIEDWLWEETLIMAETNMRRVGDRGGLAALERAVEGNLTATQIQARLRRKQAAEVPTNRLVRTLDDLEGRAAVERAANTPIEPLMSPRERLWALHKELCNEALALMEAKNADYASVSDPFRNFRTFGRLGILVRLSDKLARLRSFEENGELKVADESVRDTVLDIINYAVLYCGYEEQP